MSDINTSGSLPSEDVGTGPHHDQGPVGNNTTRQAPSVGAPPAPVKPKVDNTAAEKMSLRREVGDLFSIKEHAGSIAAGALGVGEVWEAVKAGKDNIDAEKLSSKKRPQQDQSHPATPKKSKALNPNTVKASGHKGTKGDLISAPATGSKTGDEKKSGGFLKRTVKGASSGAATGAVRGGGPHGAVAGALTGAIKANKKPLLIGAGVVTVGIVFISIFSLIAVMSILGGEQGYRVDGNAQTVSSLAAFTDGVSQNSLDTSINAALSADIPWQIVPAIRYVRENKGSLIGSASTVGPTNRFMTWNVCSVSCGNWAQRLPNISNKIRAESPDVLGIQEGGFNTSGQNVKRGIAAATGMTPVDGTYAQHVYYNSSRLEYMEHGQVSFAPSRSQGAVWVRFKKPDNTQFIVANLHPVHMRTVAADREREASVLRVIETINANNPDNLPVVYLGDYNSHPNKENSSDLAGKAMVAAGYVNARDASLQEPQNADINTVRDRAVGARVGRSQYHIDYIWTGGGTTVNSWKQVTASPMTSSGKNYTAPFVTDHNAIVADLILPARQSGVATMVNSYLGSGDPGVGPYGFDMDLISELDGGDMVTEEVLEDEGASVALLSALVAEYSREVNPRVASYTLNAGAEYDASKRDGSRLVEAMRNMDNTSVSQTLRETYVHAIGRLPITDAEEIAPIAYQVARGWALGMRACTMNAANGFINDGTWSAPLKAPLGRRSFAMRLHPILGIWRLHAGADMAAPTGTPIHAAGSGTVIVRESQSGYGNVVYIDHGNGITSRYAHMSQFNALAAKGASVVAGQVIGEVGSTGLSTGPHLHFEIRRDGKAINPMEFLRERGVILGQDAPRSPLAVAPGTVTPVSNPATEPTDEGEEGASETPPPAAGPVAIPQSFTGTNSKGQSVTLAEYQVQNAATVVAEGQKLGLGDNALTIALMTVMQESKFKMYANKKNPASLTFPYDAVGQDHDSLGLFQQRPDSGWGTTAELMDAVYNARAFYGGPSGPNNGSPRGLLDINGWESMTYGQAAQAVQVSAHPDAYDQWEGFATELLAVVKGVNPSAGCTSGNDIASAGQLSDNEIVNKAIEAAKSQLGVMYLWGGSSPATGFDCSGLVQWAYGQAGLTLPRVSRDQISAGIRITKADLSPGDLVFYGDPIRHVAMYIGNGEVIHSPRTGKPVEIVKLEHSYASAPVGYSRPVGTGNPLSET